MMYTYIIYAARIFVKYIEPDASAAITVEVYTILATAAAAAPAPATAAAAANKLCDYRGCSILRGLRMTCLNPASAYYI